MVACREGIRSDARVRQRADCRRDVIPACLGVLAAVACAGAIAQAYPSKPIRMVVPNPAGGIGNPLHIAGEMFNIAAGVELFHVPYKGVGIVVPDMVAGRIQLVFDVMAPYYSQIQSGKIKVLAVAGPARLSQMPAVPTTAEAGLPGYEVSVWFCLVAPRGTPGDVVRRLNAEVQAALAVKEVKDSFFKLGFEPQGSSPDQLSARIREDGAKWSRAVKASGATLE